MTEESKGALLGEVEHLIIQTEPEALRTIPTGRYNIRVLNILYDMRDLIVYQGSSDNSLRIESLKSGIDITKKRISESPDSFSERIKDFIQSRSEDIINLLGQNTANNI